MSNRHTMVRRSVWLLGLLTLMAAGLAWHSRDPITPQPSRYTKIDYQGNPMNTWSGPWACVLDQQTGLMWEVKNDYEDIHDGYWSYSWYDGLRGEPNLGDCYFERERCDTLDLLKRINQQKLCGATGWRLPTPDELKTLVNQQTRPGEPKIAKAFFPQTKKGDYWTSQAKQPLKGHFRYLKEGATAISFADGQVITLPYRNAAFARAVIKVSKDGH